MSKAGKLRVPEYLGYILEAIRRIHLNGAILGDTPTRHQPLYVND